MMSNPATSMTVPAIEKPVLRSSADRTRSIAGKAALWFLLWSFGVLTGGGVMYAYVMQSREPDHHRFGPPTTERIMADIQRDVGLRDDQSASVEKIVRQSIEDGEKLRQEVGPRFRAIMQNFEEQVASVLDDDQRTKWNARCEQLHKEFEERGKSRRARNQNK